MSPPRWAEPRFVFLVVFLYLAAHLAIRMAMGHALSVDDSEQALFSQNYAWAYRYKAPPLFNWMVVTIGEIAPVNAFTIGLLRYALLGTLYAFIYLVARRLLADPRLSALSLYSFAAINHFAEASHRNLTHSTALAAVTAMTWYVFLRLAAAPRLGWYLALGAALGLGVLAKWNFVILALSLPLACLLSPAGRRLVLTWKIVPAALATAVIVLPTLMATLDMTPLAEDQISAVLDTEGGRSLAQVALGTVALIDTAITAALPFLPIVAIIFGLPFWRGFQAGALRPSPNAARPDAALIGLTMAIGLALLWAAVPLAGTSVFKARYFFPALLILPVWFFMVAEAGWPSGRSLKLFALVLVALTVFVAGKRIAQVTGLTSCGLCVEWRPYGALAAQLKEAGYEGAGTILSDMETGGNMLPLFPRARIIAPDYSPTMLPARSGQGQCLLLAWDFGNPDERDPALARLGRHLSDELRADPEAPHRDGISSAPMLPPAEGTLRLGYRLYDGPNGDCR